MKKRIILIIVVILVGIWSYVIEPRQLKVNTYKIKDSELKGIKLVYASDFHIKPYQQKRLQEIVQIINAQNPDVVLSVGDFVCGHTHHSTLPIEKIAFELSKVKSKYGFYTTLGNHDGWYGSEEITENLEKNGVKVLSNSNVLLTINDKKVYIAGVEDIMTGNPIIWKALDNTQKPTILLTHSPDVFPQVSKDVNLTLAGHTHGGQVRLPLIGPIFTASKYGTKYSNGLIKENGKTMLVTKGIGLSILPLRFNCIPEIVVIEFE